MKKKKETELKVEEDAEKIEETETVKREKEEARKAKIQSLVNKRHYLEFMMLINLIYHQRRLGVRLIKKEKMFVGDEIEHLPFEHYSGQFLKLLEDQSKSILEGISNGKYDLNYSFNIENEKKSFDSDFETINKEKESDVDTSDIREELWSLRGFTDPYRSLVPADTSLIPLLLKIPGTRELVIKFLEASSNKQINNFGNEDTLKRFTKELFERSSCRNDPDYQEALIQAFFKSKNVASHLKQKCIEYYVCDGLYSRYTKAFIDNILNLNQVKYDISIGQTLVYAIGQKNEELIDYILRSQESYQLHGRIRITDKDDVPTGEYQCYSHYAYERGLTDHAKRLIEGEYFCYNYYTDKDDEELNYNMAVSFFDKVMHKNDCKLGYKIMLNYVGPRNRGSYNAKFIKHATQLIYELKCANVTEVIEMFCMGLLNYIPILNDSEAMDAISEMMVKDPKELQNKGQLLCNVLNYAAETLKSRMTAGSLVVPVRTKAMQTPKNETEGQ